MAYRKTAKVVAGLEAKRALLIASAIDVISAQGQDALTASAVIERAGVSKGLLFNYFADMTELRAAVTLHLLLGDLDAMRGAKGSDPLQTLAASMAVFYSQLGTPHLSQFRLSSPGHFDEARAALAALIRAAVPDITNRMAALGAGAALGALYGLHATMAGRAKIDASAAVLFALRGLGVTEAKAARAIERGQLEGAQ